ncbi:MAG TPA: SMP-30/gluconolactonase/LRE family protein [Amycolatopsis sp.]|nr:SMP-30/gluconolactonase/LRE family protein [Amycolatopsis sp.]
MKPAAPSLDTVPWLDGLGFPEGLRWSGARLWFSDIVRRTVHTAVPGHGSRMLTEVPGRPSGLGFHPDGTLVIASMRGRRVLRHTADGLDVLADLRPFGWRSLNDMVTHPESGISYVDAYLEDDEHGAVMLVRPDGSSEVAAHIGYPNGLIVCPGGRELVVADTFREVLRSYTIGDDGRLTEAGVFAHLPGRQPDGLCVDAEGAVWTASFLSGEFLRVERGGRVTHHVDVGTRWALSCALGGDDGTTLFLATANTTRERFLAGESEGWIELATAPVPALG